MRKSVFGLRTWIAMMMPVVVGTRAGGQWVRGKSTNLELTKSHINSGFDTHLLPDVEMHVS